MCLIVIELINPYRDGLLRPLWSLRSAGGSVTCSFCTPPTEGRACSAAGFTEGILTGLPAFMAFWWLSGQVVTGPWNDKCLTGGKRGRSVSTGGSWCGSAWCWLHIAWRLLGNRKSWREVRMEKERAQSQGMSCLTSMSSELNQNFRIFNCKYQLFFLVLVIQLYRIIYTYSCQKKKNFAVSFCFIHQALHAASVTFKMGEAVHEACLDKKEETKEVWIIDGVQLSPFTWKCKQLVIH